VLAGHFFLHMASSVKGEAMSSKPRTRKEVSEYLSERHGIRRSVQTLAKYASQGGGPSYFLISGKPFYDEADIDAWADSIKSKKMRSTAEYEHVETSPEAA
jgi:hypothetical protein